MGKAEELCHQLPKKEINFIKVPDGTLKKHKFISEGS
jgi:hypothetical protein